MIWSGEEPHSQKREWGFAFAPPGALLIQMSPIESFLQ